MRKFFIAAAVAVVALLGVSSSSDAAFRLRIETGTTTGPGVVITDGVNETGLAAGGAGAADTIVFTGNVGTFGLNVTTGAKTPTLAAPNFFEAMDLSNITISSGGAGTLRLILEADGFGSLTPDGTVLSFRQEGGGGLTAPAGSTITFQSFADDANAVPNLGPDLNVPGALASVTGIGAGSPASVTKTFGPGGFDTTASTSFTKNGTYSMYMVVTVTFTGTGSVSWDNMIGTSPAPAGLVLALVGMPVMGLGAYIRRRRTVKA